MAVGSSHQPVATTSRPSRFAHLLHSSSLSSESASSLVSFPLSPSFQLLASPPAKPSHVCLQRQLQPATCPDAHQSRTSWMTSAKDFWSETCSSAPPPLLLSDVMASHASPPRTIVSANFNSRYGSLYCESRAWTELSNLCSTTQTSLLLCSLAWSNPSPCEFLLART